MKNLSLNQTQQIVGGTLIENCTGNIQLEMNEAIALMGVSTLISSSTTLAMPYAFGSTLAEVHAGGIVYMVAMYLATSASIVFAAYSARDMGWV